MAESISGEREITWKENLLPAHLCSALLIWHQIHPKQQRLLQGRAMLEQSAPLHSGTMSRCLQTWALLLLTQHQELLHLIQKPLGFVELQLPRDKRCP